MNLNNKSGGFTLVEIAIVLVIVGLLLAGGLNMMSATADTARYKESQNNLNEIKETILGLYVNKKLLPCPDTNNPPDGFGNYKIPTGAGAGTSTSDDVFKNGTGGQCEAPRGWLPYNDLGIGGNGDAWGEKVKYLITEESTTANFFTKQADSCAYSRPNAAYSSTIRIQDLDPSAVQYIGDWAAFALVSTAKNGRQTNAGMTGAFTNDGGCTGLNAREQENCDTDSVLRFGNQMTDGTGVTFDDMVVWVGDMQLISELRKAGLCSVTSTGSGSTGSGSTGSGSTGSGSTGSGSTGSGSTGSGSTGSGSTGSGSTGSGSTGSGSTGSGSTGSGSTGSGSTGSGSIGSGSIGSGFFSPVCFSNASSDRAKCQQGCPGYVPADGSGCK